MPPSFGTTSFGLGLLEAWAPELGNRIKGVCRLAARLKKLQKPLHQPTGQAQPLGPGILSRLGSLPPTTSTCGKEPFPGVLAPFLIFQVASEPPLLKPLCRETPTAQRWKATAHSDGSTRFVESRTPIPDPPFPPVTIVSLLHGLRKFWVTSTR